MVKTLKKLILLSAVLLLAACGSKLNGTYADPSGSIAYTFSSNGKVIQSMLGAEIEMNYEVDGNKLKLGGADGVSMVLTLVDDNSISFNGTILSKK